MRKKIKPFKGKGNGICNNCKWTNKSCFCINSDKQEYLLERTNELIEATANNKIEFKRLDSYWGFLVAMSELNECEEYKKRFNIIGIITSLIKR